MSASLTAEDPLQEALRLIEAAQSRGLVLGLMGGVAFRSCAPEWKTRITGLQRDIDLATTSRDRKGVTDLLVAGGYLPDKQYNALYGNKELYFVDPSRARPVDVLVDRLEMCHSLVFADRLTLEFPTLPLADLLLSKLQVVKINRKDVVDALILLGEYPLSEHDQRGISVPRIVQVTANDWGWRRTVTANLDKLRLFHEAELQPKELDVGRPLRFDPQVQIDALQTAIDAAPKSTRWKLRARLGDRVPWYQEPEEVDHAP